MLRVRSRGRLIVVLMRLLACSVDSLEMCKGEVLIYSFTHLFITHWIILIQSSNCEISVLWGSYGFRWWRVVRSERVNQTQ
jgi:hypothetical protein